MECRIADLQDHAYGFLDPEGEARLRGHLDVCARCRADLARLAGEKRRLSDAAADLSADRRTLVPLAFAAALVVGLLWLLIPRTPPSLEVAWIPAAQDRNAEILRLRQALERTTDKDECARIQAAIDNLQVELGRKPEKTPAPEMKEKSKKGITKAAEELTRTLEKNPNDVAALVARADEYLYIKRWEQSAQDARKAIQLAPSDARAHRILGQACYYLKLGDESEAALARAVQLDPKLAGEIGHFKRTSKTQEELNAVYGKMKMSSDPDEKMKLEMQAKELGQELKLLSQGDRTMINIKEIELRLAAEPNDPVALTDRAAWHLDHGKAGPAMKDLDRAIELKPGFAVAWLKRAVAHAMSGDTDRAWKDYRRGEALDPKNQKLLDLTGGAIKKLQAAAKDSRRPSGEIEQEIVALKDRIEELKSMASNADLPQLERQRAAKESTRVQAEIDRLAAELQSRRSK